MPPRKSARLKAKENDDGGGAAGKKKRKETAAADDSAPAAGKRTRKAASPAPKKAAAKKAPAKKKTPAKKEAPAKKDAPAKKATPAAKPVRQSARAAAAAAAAADAADAAAADAAAAPPPPAGSKKRKTAESSKQAAAAKKKGAAASKKTPVAKKPAAAAKSAAKKTASKASNKSSSVAAKSSGPAKKKAANAKRKPVAKKDDDAEDDDDDDDDDDDEYDEEEEARPAAAAAAAADNVDNASNPTAKGFKQRKDRNMARNNLNSWNRGDIDVRDGVPSGVHRFRPTTIGRTIQSIGVPYVKALDLDDARYAIKWRRVREQRRRETAGERARKRAESAARAAAAASGTYQSDALADALCAANVPALSFAGRCCSRLVGVKNPSDVAGAVAQVNERLNRVFQYLGELGLEVGEAMDLAGEVRGAVEFDYISLGDAGLKAAADSATAKKKKGAAADDDDDERQPYECGGLVQSVHSLLTKRWNHDKESMPVAARAALALLEVAGGMPPSLADAERQWVRLGGGGGAQGLTTVVQSRRDVFGYDPQFKIVWLRHDAQDGSVHSEDELAVGRRCAAVDGELVRRGLPRLHMVVGPDLANDRLPGEWHDKLIGVVGVDRDVLEDYVLGKREPRVQEQQAVAKLKLSEVRDRLHDLGVESRGFTRRADLVHLLLQAVDQQDPDLAPQPPAIDEDDEDDDEEDDDENDGPGGGAGGVFTYPRAVLAVDEVEQSIRERAHWIEAVDARVTARGVRDKLFVNVVSSLRSVVGPVDEQQVRRAVAAKEKSILAAELNKKFREVDGVQLGYNAWDRARTQPFYVNLQRAGYFAKLKPAWRVLNVYNAEQEHRAAAVAQLAVENPGTVPEVAAAAAAALGRTIAEWRERVQREWDECSAQVQRALAKLKDAGLLPADMTGDQFEERFLLQRGNQDQLSPEDRLPTVLCKLVEGLGDGTVKSADARCKKELAPPGRQRRAASVVLRASASPPTTVSSWPRRWRRAATVASRLSASSGASSAEPEDPNVDPFARLPVMLRVLIIGHLGKTWRDVRSCVVASGALALATELGRIVLAEPKCTAAQFNRTLVEVFERDGIHGFYHFHKYQDHTGRSIRDDWLEAFDKPWANNQCVPHIRTVLQTKEKWTAAKDGAGGLTASLWNALDNIRKAFTNQ